MGLKIGIERNIIGIEIGIEIGIGIGIERNASNC